MYTLFTHQYLCVYTFFWATPYILKVAEKYVMV